MFMMPVSAYFDLGYQYNSILQFLSRYHEFNISMRQLKYIVNKKLNLRRTTIHTPTNMTIDAIIIENEGPGCLLGYRLLTSILGKKYGIKTSQREVMILLRALYPARVEQRRRCRLRIRIYRCRGPNAVFPIDGYDKLSKWGFHASGCIDGFFRRIIFLEVAESNHDPKLIAGYYLKAVREMGACPRLVQTDCGTESGICSSLQQLFTGNVNAHRYGTSPANQRIEYWWSTFRKVRSEFWIGLFQDLTDHGFFYFGNRIHTWAIRYSFMDLIQKYLNEVRILWNTHRIRKSQMAECISGIPDELYYLHENHGGEEHKVAVDPDLLDWAEEKCRPKGISGDTDFDDYAAYIMAYYNLQLPSNYIQALKIYFTLLESV